jgi:hypothetical protein
VPALGRAKGWLANMVVKSKEVDELVDELFNAVQLNQGYFHISDGETFNTKREFFKRIKGRLAHGQIAVQKMKAFLKKYDQIR